MATARKIVKRAARKTAQDIGYSGKQVRRYSRSVSQAIKPKGVTTVSKQMRKQISGNMTAAQARKVRKYDRKG